ncbi:MAG: SufB/SufD family protein [Bacillota bacterium]
MMAGSEPVLSLLPPSLQPLAKTGAHVVVFKDGAVHGNLGDIKGVTIEMSTDESLDELALKENFKKINTFTEENIKGNIEALRIHVGKGVRVDDPLHVFFISEGTQATQRLNLIVEEGASLSFVEYLDNASPTSINFMSNTRVKKGGNLKYTAIANSDKNSVAGISRNGWVDAMGLLNYTLAQFGDAKTAHDTTVHLKGIGANATTDVVALTSNHQEVVVKTVIDHQARQTEGHINHYGVAQDESFLVFEGTGKIGKGQKGTNARQNNYGIVLSKKARLDANPFLLIDEFDVEASHGAAIGQIDEEQLYYLMSRGLTKSRAEELIIHGFLAPFEKALGNEALNEHLSTLLERKTHSR